MSQILFLSQLLPYPPDTGAKVRSYYVLRYLSQKHRVTLLAFVRPDDPPEAIENLRKICTEVHTISISRNRISDLKSLAASLLGGTSFIIKRDYIHNMARAVDKLLASGRYDTVHSDQLWMAQYALQAKSQKPDVQLVLDEHNACYQIFQRLAVSEPNLLKRLFYEREWRTLKRYETQACGQFNQVVTVTREDQAVLHDMVYSQGINGKTVKFESIPICVDAREIQPVTPKIGPPNVLHLGTMFYWPNITGMLWFARKVWPLVLAQIPQATLTIAGKNPPLDIQNLANSSTEGAKILVTGYVPDPQPYLEKASVFIVPLQAGGGMRVKIVDAWRWGMPIVSTSTGAEGITYRDQENILIADKPEDFANAVVRILCEPDFAHSLRENGRRWVEQHYDWRQIYPLWDAVYPPDMP